MADGQWVSAPQLAATQQQLLHKWQQHQMKSFRAIESVDGIAREAKNKKTKKKEPLA